jgi:hypothetical protein
VSIRLAASFSCSQPLSRPVSPQGNRIWVFGGQKLT